MSEITYAFPKIKNVDPSCYIDAYSLILECSQMHTPRSFCVKLLELLNKACPYDAAIVFFLNANGKISGRHTIHVSEEWLDVFLNYYLKILGTISPEYDIYWGIKEGSGFDFSQLIDWSQAPKTEFITDYIDARKLKYSWSFCFFDLVGAYRVVFSLDRTRNIPFSEVERARLGLALPILNNMHRNFFYHGLDTKDHVIQSPWQEFGLTAREIEIASFLCEGMTVQNISSALCIAVTTTYKHMSHIFEKVGVTSQKELIVKLLNRKAL